MNKKRKNQYHKLKMFKILRKNRETERKMQLFHLVDVGICIGLMGIFYQAILLPRNVHEIT